MRLDRETRLLALCPLEGPSSLRQGQAVLRSLSHVGIPVSFSVTVYGYQTRYQTIILNRT